MLRAVSRGALLGAAGALLVAAGDFGASWLWLSGVSDRLQLLARLFAGEVPIGALLGASLGALAHVCAAPVRRIARRLARGANEERWERRLWPMPFVIASSPAALAIAWLLFTGGSASRLALRPLLVAAAAIALFTIVYLALRAGRAIVLAAPSMTRKRARWSVIALVLAQIAMTKIDQLVLPGLYQYLHGALTVGACLVGALAIAVLVIRSPRALSLEERAPAAGVALATVMIAVLLSHVLTLDANHAVRVALLSPRAAGSRSIMLVLGPALSFGQSRASAAEVERARRARARRRGRVSLDGPMIDGAHVLLVTIDALRADHLGTYGYRARPVSPEIDRFARDSIVFEQAFAQAPHSSHSIASLMTSDYVFQRAEVGLALPEETLASTLREVGYHAVAFYTEGIFHTDGEQLSAYRTSAFGFGRRSHDDVDAEEMTDDVLDEMSRIVEVGEPPSLIWAHYFDVHEPYRDTSFGRADVDRYDGEIRQVDRAFARLLSGARDRFERPLVVALTADHGEEFREHGGVYHGSSLYQEQIRIPLLLQVPGVAARRVRAPVEIVDLAPTLLGLVGVAASGTMRGDDLRPLLAGEEPDLGPAFASMGTQHMVVAWPFKLISDLRLGTVELYDLYADPGERRNLADENAARVESLRGELTLWLDSLADSRQGPHETLLHRGRLGDRTAAPGLAVLVADEGADASMRAEAARLLARIPRANTIASLRAAAASPEREVAAEAAISLAWLGASGPRAPLLALLEDDDDEERRLRTAIGLGRLRDLAAVPTLIDAAGSSSVELRLRGEAIRLLGLLRDARAVEPLLDLLDDERVCRPAVVSLGRIGDLRAYEPLVLELTSGRYTTVREASARALGQLGDPRAVPHLARAAAEEPLPSAGESLVRLGAVGAYVGGLELAPGVEASGLGACHALSPGAQDQEYLDRTYCETSGPRVALALAVPASLERARSVVLLLRLRRIDESAAVQVGVSLGGRALATVRIDGAWSEHRLGVRPSALAPELALDVRTDSARVAIDHALLLPVR